jgi:hypothetical protein
MRCKRSWARSRLGYYRGTASNAGANAMRMRALLQGSNPCSAKATQGIDPKYKSD